MEVNLSLGGIPGKNPVDAMNYAMSGKFACDPLASEISLNHVQICPQNFGTVNENLIERLNELFPNTRFRLHANVGLFAQRRVVDLANWGNERFGLYWDRLIEVNGKLRGPAYTVHAGLRSDATLTDLFGYVLDLESRMQCPVGIEGMYPVRGNPYLCSSWTEYRQLFDSGVRYALDLSHLNIVARTERRVETGLVKDMLTSPNCIEIHVSGNDGNHDQHRAIDGNEWWIGLLDRPHPGAVVFTEGNLREGNRTALPERTNK